MKTLPIRLRLTLWYFVMFSVAALLLSLSSWWMLRRTLDATVHQELQERIDDVSTQLHEFGAARNLKQAQGQFAAFYRDRDDGKWLQILDQDGQWVYRSARMTSINLGLSSPTSLPWNGLATDFVQSNHAVRALSIKVIVDGRAYSVQTGISLKKPRALLHDFALGLLLLTPAVLLPAAIGGHVMSRKALTPVAAIAHEVRRITDRNLDRRLPVSETNDELSHLSITLNHMLERIDFAFRSVRDFTANASHELRTPLARLRTETEIGLMRPREAAEYRAALDRVHGDAVDMTGIIENLLTLARAEAGSEILRLIPVDLKSLVELTVKEWTPLAERRSLTLHTAGLNATDGGRPLVLGDRVSLLRLLRIWMDNACKFTPAGGSVVLCVSAEKDTVLLAVEDSGLGIPPEHQGRIFDRFYRVQGDRMSFNAAAQSQGAGLGLSLAAWIAEQHKTHIGVVSTVGIGSRFEVRLVRVGNEDPNWETTHSSVRMEVITRS